MSYYNPDIRNTNNSNFSYTSGNDTILGKKLNNPYTITNMQADYDATVASFNPKEVVKMDKIEATHLYVKFKPSNDFQYSALSTTDDLIIYNYPLDYEIIGSTHLYHDPEVPDDVPTYQYAAVPVKFNFIDSISYEPSMIK